jgi:hypothetical protein
MGSGPVNHCWGKTDEDVASMVKLYAEHIVAPMKAAGYKALTGLSLWDELGWGYPRIWTGATSPGSPSGRNNVSGNPRVFASYHKYIKERSGFTTPQEFGADSWADVVPITFANVTKATPREKVLGMRARVYWSVRFAAWDVVTWFGAATAALMEANDWEQFYTYTNCNNFHGRLFTPGGVSVQAGTGVKIPKDDHGKLCSWPGSLRVRPSDHAHMVDSGPVSAASAS